MKNMTTGVGPTRAKHAYFGWFAKKPQVKGFIAVHGDARVDSGHVGQRDVFLISLKAGGTGLNLTGADTVILYDLWWNPAVEDQAADRAHRIGQKNVVRAIRMVASGTNEERIFELQQKKRNLIDQVVIRAKAPSAPSPKTRFANSLGCDEVTSCCRIPVIGLDNLETDVFETAV